jgi:hypothetical protein
MSTTGRRGKITGMEHALAGGNVAAGVVRVGGTVRKPAGYWTPGVEALLAHLEAGGFTGAPRPLGRDGRGRQVLEYVPGPMAIDAPPLGDAGLHRVGRLIRELHDACAGFEPPPGARWNVAIPPDRADLICHHDLAPWNLVLGADRWVFIDWDGAGPRPNQRTNDHSSTTGFSHAALVRYGCCIVCTLGYALLQPSPFHAR